MRNKTLFKTLFLLLISFVLLSYNDDPPNGRTGAPFDGKCSDCHTNNNPGGFNGTAEILGLPDTVLPSTTYAIRLKAVATAGNPVRAGFQLVVVDKNNQNAGDLIATNAETETEFLDGREYLDHRGGKYFSAGPVFWDFKWTSPSNTECSIIKFFYIVNFCNGGGDFGDFPVAFADSVCFAGGLDTIAPHLVCPPSFAVCATDTVRYSNPVISDNCGAVSAHVILLNGLPGDTVFPLGITTQIFQATDLSGNTASCSFSVQVNALPVVVLDSLSPDIGNAGIGSIFITVSEGAGAPYSFVWKKDGVIFNTEMEDISNLFSSTYSFEIQDSLGCSTTLTDLVLGNISSVDPLYKASVQLRLSPQPVISDWFGIEGKHEAPVSLSLFNVQGQLVKNISISTWPGPFDIAEIPSGLYNLRMLFRDGGISYLRLLKY